MNRSLLALALLAPLGATDVARAGVVRATANWALFNSNTNNFPAAVTRGRGYIDGGRPDATMATQDPATAVALGTRIVPPNILIQRGLPNVPGFYDKSDVTVGFAGGWKTINTEAWRAFGSLRALAEARDPISYSAIADPSILTLESQIFDLRMLPQSDEIAEFEKSASVTLGSQTLDIFRLTITCAPGASPVVNLSVGPYAAAHGWDAQSLRSQIAGAFTQPAPGDYRLAGFNFPSLPFDLNGGLEASLSTLDVVALPAPGAALPAAGLFLLARRRR